MDVLGGLVGIGQSLIQRNTDKKNIERQTAANMKLAEYNFNKNKEMWDLQNEYNSPKSQMQRFSEGGLNPNLMYGQGSTGNSSVAPRYEQEAVDQKISAPNVGNSIANYQDARIKEAQIDNLKADRRVKEAEAVIRASEAQFRMDILRAKLYGIKGTAEKTHSQAFRENQLNAIDFGYSTETSFFTKPENAVGTVRVGTDLEKPLFKDARQSLQKYQIQSAPFNLQQTQAKIAEINMLNDIREFERKFLQGGGKWLPSANQLLRSIISIRNRK